MAPRLSMPLPEPVLALAAALGERAAPHLVGGAPRDLLLGRAPRDFDLACALRPDEVMAVARDRGWPALPVGERFGTVSVTVGGMAIEVTTFRAEGRYLDGRRPSAVAFVDDVRADLARRDFTVNALAISLPWGTLVDPFGGRRDLSRGLVRTVGDPARRFAEDGLRLLRAVRLAAELGFRVEDATWLAMAVHAEGLVRVAAERIGPEIERILLAPGRGAAVGLERLVTSGLAAHCLPEAVPMLGQPPDGEYHRLPLLGHTMEVVTLVPRRPAVRWAALFHDAGKPFTRTVDEHGRPCFHGHDALGARLFAMAARRLRLPRDLAARVEVLVARHMFGFDMGPRGMRRLLADLGEEGVRDLLDLKLADIVGTGGVHVGPAFDAFLAFRARLREAHREATALTTRDLAVDGRDVMRVLGIGPGPAVGRTLDRLLERVLEEPALNERNRLLGLLRETNDAAGGPGRTPEDGSA